MLRIVVGRVGKSVVLENIAREEDAQVYLVYGKHGYYPNSKVLPQDTKVLMYESSDADLITLLKLIWENMTKFRRAAIYANLPFTLPEEKDYTNNLLKQLYAISKERGWDLTITIQDNNVNDMEISTPTFPC